MTNDEQAYLVLNDREINALLKRYRRNKRANVLAGRGGKHHTIVLKLTLSGPEYNGTDGERQIAGFSRALMILDDETARTERVAPSLRAVLLK